MAMDECAVEALRRLGARPMPVVGESARSDALRLLLTRFSVSPKHLGEPGPSDEELSVIALAALRGPDHDKLIPFRFVVIRGDGLERLAELFVDYGRRRGKSGEALAAERERAVQAPVVLAVIGRIDETNEAVPVHEQWAAVGGAIGNALNALHIMGYAGKMLSGVRAADTVIGQAFCRTGETLLGWISIGTPKTPPKPRGEVDPGLILSSF